MSFSTSNYLNILHSPQSATYRTSTITHRELGDLKEPSVMDGDLSQNNPIFYSEFCHEDSYESLQILFQKGDYSISTIQNLSRGSLSLQQRIELAYLHYLHISHLSENTAIRETINDFGLHEERERSSFAHKILDATFEDKISEHFADFHITHYDERVKVAQKAATKRSSAVLRNLTHYNITKPEDLYHTLAVLIRSHNKIDLIKLKELQLEQELFINLVKKIGTSETNSYLIQEWTDLQLDDETSLNLLLFFAQENPALLHNNWSYIKKMSPRIAEALDNITPFSQLNKLHKQLNTLVEHIPFTLSNQETWGRLEKILEKIHRINKNSPIPFSLEGYFLHIASGCTQDELVELAKLINRHFFAQSLILQKIVYSFAVSKLPKISCYVELISTIAFKKLYVPILTAEGVDQLIKEKLKKADLTEQVFTAPSFPLKELPLKVHEFYRTGKTKAVFSIIFTDERPQHLTSIIIEREGASLKIFNSDSLSDDTNALIFSEPILHTLKELSLPVEFYATTYRREKDIVSCRTFTVKDISEFIKIFAEKQGSFFDYLESASTIEVDNYEDIPFKRVINPPSAFMKMTQSLKKIREIGLKGVEKKGISITLDEYVKENTFMTLIPISADHLIYKLANLTAEKKSAKYFEKTLCLAVEHHKKAEE